MIKLISIPALSQVRETGRASNDEDAAIGAGCGGNGAISDGADSDGDDPAGHKRQSPERAHEPHDCAFDPNGYREHATPLLREGGLTSMVHALLCGCDNPFGGGLFTSGAGGKSTEARAVGLGPGSNTGQKSGGVA